MHFRWAPIAVCLMLQVSCNYESIQLAQQSEKERYFHNNPTLRERYEVFAITSPDSELFHSWWHSLSLVEIRRSVLKSNGVGNLDEQTNEFLKNIHDPEVAFWKSFQSDIERVGSGGSLYRVEFRKNGVFHWGYYYIKNGKIEIQKVQK